LKFFCQTLVEIFSSWFDFKIFSVITIEIENRIRINQTLIFIFQSHFD